MRLLQKLDKYNYTFVSILLLRVMVGLVFISEGIQKFIYPDIRGVGRFIKIDFPAPEFLGYFVAAFEVLCGTLILLGLFTRYAAVPLIVIMLTAIVTTKIPILLNEGFWEKAHAARTDWSMLIGAIVLLLSGSGKYSIEKLFHKQN